MTEVSTTAKLAKSISRRQGWLATAGVLGAFLASACCIVPLALVLMGVSGAWIGNLTALEPYKPFTGGIAIVFIAAGFWHVYLKPKVACEPGSHCERPQSSRLTKAALWFAAVLVAFALTVNWWGPLLY